VIGNILPFTITKAPQKLNFLVGLRHWVSELALLENIAQLPLQIPPKNQKERYEYLNKEKHRQKPACAFVQRFSNRIAETRPATLAKDIKSGRFVRAKLCGAINPPFATQ